MMKDTFQEVCSFNSTCVDLSGPLVLGLSDQKFLVASAHSWQALYTCEVIERIMFFFLSYSSFCLCGMYVMVHGREGFLKTQVTSEHYYIWNNIVSIETLNQTGPERFPVNLNQHTVGKFAAVCFCTAVCSQWPWLRGYHHGGDHKHPWLLTSWHRHVQSLNALQQYDTHIHLPLIT